MEETSSPLLSLLTSRFSPDGSGAAYISAYTANDDVVVQVSAQKIKPFLELCKSDPQLHFDMLLSVTVVDWMDKKDERFEVVYHLLSIPNSFRIRIKVELSESNPMVPTVCDLWSSANFMEREAYDMYGVKFEGHPNLERILMYPEFVGFPLRKDYPLHGKQPRIPLRSPEVRNTSLDMKRPDLVSINRPAATRRSVN